MQIIREKVHSRTKVIKTKTSPVDLVTETDQEIETFFVENISKNFPDHKFIGEESTASTGVYKLTNTPTWIIDPIDGTMNFIHSFPNSCISIALFIEQQSVIGIIYNPNYGQLFTARKGKGAFLNGERIMVSGTKTLSDALIMMECIGGHNPEKGKVILKNAEFLLTNSHG